MFPVLPSDLLASSVELMCYGFTVLAALASYLMLPR
jgi:hypothetical protein